MWDGSYESSRSVSLRGKSAPLEGRKAFKEKVRLEREKRALEKLQLESAVKIQAALRSSTARVNAKTTIQAAWVEKMQAVKMMADCGMATPAVAISGLCSMLLFWFDDRSLGVDISNVQLLSNYVTGLLESGQGSMFLGRQDNFRAVNFASVLLRLIKIVHDVNGDVEMGKDFSKCFCKLVASSGDPDDARRLRVDLVSSPGKLHSRGLTLPMTMEMIVMCKKVYANSELGNVLKVICSCLSDSMLEDTVSKEAENMGVRLFETVLAKPANAFEALGYSSSDTLKFIYDSFSRRSWSKLLQCLWMVKLSNVHVVSNTIKLSMKFRQLGESESSSETTHAEFMIDFWYALGSLLYEARHLDIFDGLDELEFLRSPQAIQNEFETAFRIQNETLSVKCVLTLCRAFERIRTQWVKSKQVNKREKRAIDSLSPANVVVSAIAYSRSLVYDLWCMILNRFDTTSFVTQQGTVFKLFEELDTLGVDFVSFTCACTSLLLPALDDEELFVQGKPFKVSELGSMALFLRQVLYQVLWIQAGIEEGKRMNVAEATSKHFSEAAVLKIIECYDRLYECHCRHAIMKDELWLFPNIHLYELGVQQQNGQSGFTRTRWVTNTQQSGFSSAMSTNSDDDEDDDVSMGRAEGGAQQEVAVETVSPENASARVKRILRDVPEVVSFSQRVLVFDHFLQEDYSHEGGRRGAFSSRVTAKIRRGYEYADAFRQLAECRENLKHRVQIEFVNSQGLAEAGIDGGGVFKEFLMEFCKQAFDPEVGLWQVTVNNELYPNPDSGGLVPGHLVHFEFIGRLIGKAVYEGILVELNFADFFLNSVLGRRNHIHDLQSLDPEIYKNVLQLKSIPDPSILGLTFSVSQSSTTSSSEIDLIPSGGSIPVTKENFIMYISRLANFRLNEQTQSQARAFFSGFSDMIPRKWIQMFKARELQLLIAGSDEGYDIADMKTHCTYSGGYHPSQPYIESFWEVVSDFDREHKALLLRFITSCSKPPLQGFGALNPKFCIHCVRITKDEDRLPSASTCFNQLKLPMYSSKQVLKDKLLLAITSGAGFELS
uniref:HECT-type E3 ubiquitin transferase n=1 Tax=Mucochytrium quahogii TaxID=96639 RepID=A0A7S2W8Q6_9STRA|mmetsp:Transcript_42467/g.68339  ORF Transcript_42467/g.68339 Transcript_42467/m.68339 type:complete len:1058 (+) Transcript_42467:413-3586(+)|eukprot:CAMPEP_0203762020 /NCGR_PEP_ID=MMETSP0098-20131031/14992_1 /ASSEMBLY_ACC=CAM_ASM_000208 /TAXON_ID=96639 /ORGANISM=" , Strain NY0313808BC1" /LENGTH=1057 /DNA_ID=CAMNT_0050656259 /DNA_START=183 /DNA_END=3356 /DNA_ORIENTATION=+